MGDDTAPPPAPQTAIVHPAVQTAAQRATNALQAERGDAHRGGTTSRCCFEGPRPPRSSMRSSLVDAPVPRAPHSAPHACARAHQTRTADRMIAAADAPPERKRGAESNSSSRNAGTVGRAGAGCACGGSRRLRQRGRARAGRERRNNPGKKLISVRYPTGGTVRPRIWRDRPALHGGRGMRVEHVPCQGISQSRPARSDAAFNCKQLRRRMTVARDGVGSAAVPPRPRAACTTFFSGSRSRRPCALDLRSLGS